MKKNYIITEDTKAYGRCLVMVIVGALDINDANDKTRLDKMLEEVKIRDEKRGKDTSTYRYEIDESEKPWYRD